MNSKPLTLHKQNYFPSQWEFLVNKKKARIKAFVGGFGSGNFNIGNALYLQSKFFVDTHKLVDRKAQLSIKKSILPSFYC